MAITLHPDHSWSIETFADVCCPFAHVGLRRLTTLRRQNHVRRFWVHAWPLELVNGTAVDGDELAAKVDALRRQVAPEMFAGFRPSNFPASSMPAFAVAAAAYRRSDDLGEAVSLALRDELFEQGRDISDPDVLAALWGRFGLPAPTRDDSAQVELDWAAGQQLGVQGSPQFFVDGQTWFCPALRIAHSGDEIEVVVDHWRTAELLRAIA